jgi:acyl carrier protein
MADKAVLERVKKVTARVLGVDLDTIEEKANFVFDLGAESCDWMLIVV